MTSSTDFDRLLASWLETAGPADARPEALRGALEKAKSMGQRGLLSGFLFGPATWPRPRRGAGFAGLPPTLRIALVTGLLITLVGATLIGSGGFRGLLGLPSTTPPANLRPSAPTPTLAIGASEWDAIYMRPVSDAVGADVAVYLVRPDGQERVVRRISTASLEGISGFETWSLVSKNGWLALATQSITRDPLAPYGRYAIFQLGDPGRPALLVPENGAVGGRWSSGDLFAVPKPNDFRIDVVEPRTGATTELGRIVLFGGGPSIVWASDGSGILDAGRLRPVDGSPDIQIDPQLRFDDRRVGRGGQTIETCPTNDPAGASVCAGATSPTVRVFDLGRTRSVDWYTSPDATEVIGFSPAFAADGRALWLTLDRVVNGHHEVVVAVADAPFHLTTIATIPLPADGFDPYLWNFAPDDSQMFLGWSIGTRGDPQPGPTLVITRDGSQRPAPAGSFAGYVEGPLAESWPALTEFGLPTP